MSHAATPVIPKLESLLPAAVLSRLDSIINCPVCQDQLDSPTTLQCGHSFCISCLEWQLRGQQAFCRSCPLCRTVFQANQGQGQGQGTAASFAVNVALRDFIDMVRDSPSASRVAAAAELARQARIWAMIESSRRENEARIEAITAAYEQEAAFRRGRALAQPCPVFGLFSHPVNDIDFSGVIRDPRYPIIGSISTPHMSSIHQIRNGGFSFSGRVSVQERVRDYETLFPLGTDAVEVLPVNAPPAVAQVQVQQTYTVEQLRAKNGIRVHVEAARKETYLTDADFLDVFKMTKEQFASLPKWRKKQKKIEAGLF